MDEMDMIDFSKKSSEQHHHYFQLLTEKERDDGIHYIVNKPVDLNGDGRTDFVTNKYYGNGNGVSSQKQLLPH